jgi:hypothetical protein
VGKKSNKRTQPHDAESSLNPMVSGVGKNSLLMWLAGGVMPTFLIATGWFIGIYPLKQFAPVIQSNYQGKPSDQGRIAMGSQPPAELFAVQVHLIRSSRFLLLLVDKG